MEHSDNTMSGTDLLTATTIRPQPAANTRYGTNDSETSHPDVAAGADVIAVANDSKCSRPSFRDGTSTASRKPASS